MNPKAYSTFRTEAWQAFKWYCENRRLPRSEVNYREFANAVYQGDQLLAPMTPVQDALTRAEVLSVFLWKFRRIRHFFLAPGVADFCVGAVKELSEDYSNVLPECPHVPGVGGTGRQQSGFALHFPASERGRSIICMPDFQVPAPGNAYHSYYVAVTDGESVAVLNRNTDLPPADAETQRMEKTVFGFSLYIAAFPGALHPGEPGQIHVVSHYRGDHTVVGRTAVVDEEDRAATSPHWRRGHFNLLTHPRYTHKRFQSVYIRGCFVRGDALEVDALAAPAPAPAA
jgi:hypothetical protein